MNKNGPIVVIEDDVDDQHILTQVFEELKFTNEIIFFSDGDEALKYLNQETTFPFLILSDINLPKLNGLELKKMIQTNDAISRKCIPYLFFTTAIDRQAVYDAYTMSAQGFFVKPTSYNQLVTMMRKIVEYWQECYAPNHFQDR